MRSKRINVNKLLILFQIKSKRILIDRMIRAAAVVLSTSNNNMLLYRINPRAKIVIRRNTLYSICSMGITKYENFYDQNIWL